jgi:CRP-like cAMP-binding protein
LQNPVQPHNNTLLIQNLRRHIELSDADCLLFNTALQPKTLKKKEYLLKEHQVADSAAFVIQGCLCSYSVDANGFRHNLQFAPPDWWITDMYSFISGLAGHLNIQALEHSEVLLLSRENQLKLFNQIPALERYFRILTEKSLVSSRKRLMDNLSLSAEQRYLNFCTAYPGLINHLTQKEIASYIGVTPEFLSKLRHQLAKAGR